MRAHQARVTGQPSHILSILCVCLLPQAISLAAALIILKWLYTAALRPIPNASGRKRILVTGGNVSSILGMSRALEAAGHHVYVVDYERAPFSSPLRSSNAIARFVALPAGRLSSGVTAIKTKFFQLGSIVDVSFDISQKQQLVNVLATILQLIENQKIELWIPIEGNGLQTVLQTKAIVTKHSTCRIYGPDLEVNQLAQDQARFSQFVEHLEHDIRCPAAIVVKRRAEIHRILSESPTGQKYVLEKNVSPTKLPLLPPESEPDPASRVCQKPGDRLIDRRYTLPLSSLNDTYSSVAALSICREQPWLMQQVLEGRPIIVSALLIDNTVTTFTASVSPENTLFLPKQPSENNRGMTHERRDKNAREQSSFTRHLDPKSTTARMLLEFTQRFSCQLPANTNAQLNLRFILTESATSGAILQRIWATGCDFEISPRLIEQALISGQLRSIGTAFGCALNGEPTLLSVSSTPFEDRDAFTTFSLPAAFYQQLFRPFVTVMLRQAPFQTILSGLAGFLNHVAFSHEELFDFKDPLPWVWRWLVQIPFERAANLGEYTMDILIKRLKQSERKCN